MFCKISWTKVLGRKSYITKLANLTKDLCWTKRAPPSHLFWATQSNCCCHRSQSHLGLQTDRKPPPWKSYQSKLAVCFAEHLTAFIRMYRLPLLLSCVKTRNLPPVQMCHPQKHSCTKLLHWPFDRLNCACHCFVEKLEIETLNQSRQQYVLVFYKFTSNKRQNFQNYGKYSHCKSLRSLKFLSRITLYPLGNLENSKYCWNRTIYFVLHLFMFWMLWIYFQM